MRIVGIDLSLTRTGIATYRDGGQDGAELEVHSIKTAGAGSGRVSEICASIWGTAGQPDVLVIEGYAFGAKGNALTGLAELRGVLLYPFWCKGTPIVTIPPAQLKQYATGSGAAGKDDVLLAVERRYGHLVEVRNNDEADALVLLAMALDHYGHSLGVVPAVNVRGLNSPKLDRWPTLRPSLSRAA